MQRRYSRFQSIEEKRSIKRAFMFSILSVVLIAFILIMGISLVGKFTAYINDSRGNKLIDSGDTTPPGPPFINSLPSATDKNTIQITGTTESLSTIELTLNGRTEVTVSDESGSFTIEVTLDPGQNEISANAVDGSGNRSKKSQTFYITFSNQPPSLEVTEPQDGTRYYGSKQRSVSVKGKTDPGIEVTINERVVRVNEDGSFVFSLTLSEGDNTVNIKAVDSAGNTSEKSLTLIYSS